MQIEQFLDSINIDFYSGVPDSQLKPLCDCLMQLYGIDSRHHIIAANEGSCAALAAGYHLATGRVPAVYMQNSGEGNIINPYASLLHKKVYGIPCLFIIGWRGEPGIHDEPQHIFQGEVTLPLLKIMDIPYIVLDKETDAQKLSQAMNRFQKEFDAGGCCAIVVRKGALSFDRPVLYQNACSLTREEIIRCIVSHAGGSPIVCTTGKASRELFEIREQIGQGHGQDFLTVGSMGHSVSIALGIALQKPERTVWCIDGDGACLMHMGAMAVVGSQCPKNLIHIVINNGAHETVGGMPTVTGTMNLPLLAKACGYPFASSADEADCLERELIAAAERHELSFLEVKCAIGARADLGRPTTTARENRDNFMAGLEA